MYCAFSHRYPYYQAIIKIISTKSQKQLQTPLFEVIACVLEHQCIFNQKDTVVE